MKRVTIKDIAQIANVSRGTVDRVINNRGNVSSDIKRKIEKIASDLGFEKNVLASNLASNKVNTLVVICPDGKSDMFWYQPKKGMEQAISLLKHYNLIVKYFEYDITDRNAYVLQCSNAILENPDAILVAPNYLQESMEFLDNAQAKNIPVITINAQLNHPHVLTYIGQNSFASGYLAGRLLHLRLERGDTVLALTLSKNSQNAAHYMAKIEGFATYIRNHFMDAIEVINLEFPAYDDPQALTNFFANVETNYPNLKAIFFTNSRAYKLCQLLSHSQCLDRYIVGFDLLQPNIDLLKDGKIDFIINQNPLHQGYMGVMSFVKAFILNQDLAKENYLPLDIVVKENVDFYAFDVLSVDKLV